MKRQNTWKLPQNLICPEIARHSTNERGIPSSEEVSRKSKKEERTGEPSLYRDKIGKKRRRDGGGKELGRKKKEIIFR